VYLTMQRVSLLRKQLLQHPLHTSQLVKRWRIGGLDGLKRGLALLQEAQL